MLRAGVWWCCDNANANADTSASVNVDDCVSCIDDDDDSGTGTGADHSCGHDNGAHYDGSVFGDVQGCKLLGQWILRAVLWIQAGQQWRCGLSFVW